MAGPWPGPGTLVAAVSGGADSVAMLRLLAEQAPERGWRLVVGHVDHGLRADSAVDAAFVADLAGALGLEWRVVGVVARQAGLSPEDAARRARRQALLALAGELDAVALALAHTIDDQAETVLARLLTGAGPGGLAAMRPWSGPLWRPLLAVRGRELRDYLAALGQPWREDPSNADRAYQRNRLRHAVLPLCRQLINPRADEALARLAGLLADEEDYWRGLLDDALAAHGRREGASLCLSLGWLLAQPPFLRRRMMRHIAGRLLGGGQHLLFDHVAGLERLLTMAAGKSLTLPFGLRAWREHEHLRLAPDVDPPPLRARLDGPGLVELPALGAALLAREVAPGAALRARGGRAWLPLEDVRWPLELCWPWPGMRFWPLGAPGGKRLSKIAIDRKIPPWWRKRLLVVADEGGPWWVWPLAPAQRARVRADEPLLELSLVDSLANWPYSIEFKGPISDRELPLPTWAEP